MKPIIYLDMDGVLADFDGWAARQFPDWKTEIKKPNWGGFAEHPNIFAHLPPMPSAKELYEGCVDFIGDKNQVQILTALPNRGHFPAAVQDKIDWVKRHISPNIRVRFGPFAQHKQLYVHHPLDVLIDDVPLNIQQWDVAGGIGILHKSTTESLNELIVKTTQKLHKGLYERT